MATGLRPKQEVKADQKLAREITVVGQISTPVHSGQHRGVSCGGKALLKRKKAASEEAAFLHRTKLLITLPEPEPEQPVR